jgi:allantoinase
VHAEAAGCIADAPHSSQYDDFLHSRPQEAENRAVGRLIELSSATGCRVHVLHVSSAEALPLIATAKRDGVRITAETCPHYLTFTAEEIPDGATQFKCCPPIREADNREQLWQGLREGVLDIVVSDHSPSTVDLKALDTGDFGVAWGGISSLQLGLSAIWTGARERGIPLVDVVRWMSTGPADLVGLSRKGRIAVGADADLCVFAPDEEWQVAVHALQHRNQVTPYDGRTLTGVVRGTWLHGERIDLSAGPRGRLLTRGE